MTVHPAYLGLGAFGIRVNFDSSHLAEEVRAQILLSDHFEGEIIGEVHYLEDESVSQVAAIDCPPNAVLIRDRNLADGHREIRIKMFGRFAFAIDVHRMKIAVRYPHDAPVRILADDVLHVALQQLLESIGGIILHGSCVAQDGRAIVLMGQSGAGKSSTAFNLTRFGFECYADDAVLVTPQGDRLWVWPMAREVSIRPLSFRLFAEQGIRLSGYQKEAGKYYFPTQRVGNGEGALLEHLCFLELSGEAETVISRLSADEALEQLLRDARHFTSMAQKSAPVYSRLLARSVPSPLLACLGMDLDGQGRAFEKIILGRGSALPARTLSQPTRRDKLSLIRRAWSDPGEAPLAELIPLLADVDPKVFTLAYAFFQTSPLARFEPMAAVDSNSEARRASAAAWLHPEAWFEGCRRLAERADVEVFHAFALSWIKSAPLIYPFLVAATAHDPDRVAEVQSAWKRYSSEKRAAARKRAQRVEVHVADFLDESAWSDPAFMNWWSRLLSRDDPAPQIYFWATRSDRAAWGRMAAFLAACGKEVDLTVVPVGSEPEKDFAFPLALVRFARDRGLSAGISRLTPLCRLDEAASREVLEADAFERAIEQAPARRLQYLGSDVACEALPLDAELRAVTWPGARVSWLEGGHVPCGTCGLPSLALCRGGFFRTGVPQRKNGV
jgi:hypothetical protein